MCGAAAPSDRLAQPDGDDPPRQAHREAHAKIKDFVPLAT